ncbi:MAG TPA: hypothetical protein LFW13_04575 [Rickettsia endosymbiont of Sericostoma sp.]|nr:hypothetical protein [Rickettsia endosymbiont of Sericostoma sp.]
MREGIADEAIVRVHACSSGYIKGNQEEAALGVLSHLLPVIFKAAIKA